jgi:precorrin-6Y C5,15-methyltransferase (decarboxylating)
VTGQLTAGLPDDAFASDGLLTKRVLRAAALASLAPLGNELLWDLGAGTGSIGIEWCRLSPGNRAVAVERRPERAERIRENAARHGVAPRLTLVESDIAAALPGLPAPDAVFVSGGVDEQVLQHCWNRLPAGGRLAVHSVTADSDAVLLDAYRTWGGELSRVAVETAEPIGRFTGFRPARTVTTWVAVRE